MDRSPAKGAEFPKPGPLCGDCWCDVRGHCGGQAQAANLNFAWAVPIAFACGAHGFRTAAQYLQERGIRQYEEDRLKNGHPLEVALNNTVGGLFFGALAMWGAFNIQF